jgi:hypothetical protein
MTITIINTMKTIKLIIAMLLLTALFSCKKEPIEIVENYIVDNTFVIYHLDNTITYNFNTNRLLEVTNYYKVESHYNYDTIINNNYYYVYNYEYYYGFKTEEIGEYIQLFNKNNKLVEEWFILEITKEQFKIDNKIYLNLKYHNLNL